MWWSKWRWRGQDTHRIRASWKCIQNLVGCKEGTKQDARSRLKWHNVTTVPLKNETRELKKHNLNQGSLQWKVLVKVIINLYVSNKAWILRFICRSELHRNGWRILINLGAHSYHTVSSNCVLCSMEWPTDAKMCSEFIFLQVHSTCFGRYTRPSSGVQV